MARVFGISQYFIKRNNRSHIVLLTAQLSEDFLVAGKLNDINDFSTASKQRFTVGKVISEQGFISVDAR